MSLTGLGLTAQQERAYRELLRTRPGASAQAAAADESDAGARTVLTELRLLGLVDENLAAVPPAAAVDLLVRRRITQAQRQFEGIAAAWDALRELTEEQRTGRPAGLIEQLPNGPETVRRIYALLTDHPGEFSALRTDALHDESRHDSVRHGRLLIAGLRSRTLFPAQALEDPLQAAHASRRHALGELHRVTTEPVWPLILVNRSVAFVPADLSDPEAGVLQIRRTGVVRILAEVFDGIWDRARDLGQLPVSPDERRVLRALTRYDTDESAARALNVSVRKFRAHVADLMDRLGARTRFQAALLAKERNWL
ncbi:helix-turn-helix transcriptional regulator [Nocardia niwae]|uniref:HTH luxR-type domain-containing protein n=1 Tax=Nocardia niwae TaxID=626084 RepID=A0ABV2X4Z1_9NOCA